MIKTFSFLFCFFIIIPARARTDSSAVSFDTLTVIGVGDIMMGTDYPSAIYLPPGNDCKPLLNDVNTVLRDADITFGNLEGTFAGDIGNPKKCKDTTKCFVFRMPDHYVAVSWMGDLTWSASRITMPMILVPPGSGRQNGFLKAMV